MKTASKLAAIFLAALAITAQIAQAATAVQLKTTIDSYGLSAAVAGNTVTVTGTKTNATAGLNLDINAGITVIWKAELSGNVSDPCGIVGCIGPASDPELFLVRNNGSGVLEVQSGSISNAGPTPVVVNNSEGTVKISGGTVVADNGLGNAIRNSVTGFVRLSGAPTITGLIFTKRIIVDAAFAPGEKKYRIHYSTPIQCMVMVEGGGGFFQNFEIGITGWTLAVSGNDIVIIPANDANVVHCPEPSSSSNAPSSSSATPPSSSSVGSSSSSSVGGSSSSSGTTPIRLPQIISSSIHALAINNAIVLENLPKNAKVEIYNLQGKRIYSAYPENSQILKIPVKAKGMYIVKVSFGK